MTDKVDLKTFDPADYEGKFLVFPEISKSGDVYYAVEGGAHNVFKIEGSAAYRVKLDEKTGETVTDEKPVVKLEGNKVTYVAKRDTQDPYDYTKEVREDTIIGNPGAGFIQALKLHIQSFQFFNFEIAKMTEARILNAINGLEDDLSENVQATVDGADGSGEGTTGDTTVEPDATTTTTKGTTTTTTVKPTTTTTRATTTTTKATTTTTTTAPAEG